MPWFESAPDAGVLGSARPQLRKSSCLERLPLAAGSLLLLRALGGHRGVVMQIHQVAVRILDCGETAVRAVGRLEMDQDALLLQALDGRIYVGHLERKAHVPDRASSAVFLVDREVYASEKARPVGRRSVPLFLERDPQAVAVESGQRFGLWGIQ